MNLPKLRLKPKSGVESRQGVADGEQLGEGLGGLDGHEPEECGVKSVVVGCHWW